MSLMPAAPRPIGGVLDNAFRLYRHALLPCMPLALVAVILQTVVATYLTLKVMPQAVSDPQAVFAMLRMPSVWLGYLGLIVVGVVIQGALFLQVDAIARGQKVAVGAALGGGLQRTPAMLGMGFLLALICVVGFLLLIVPGIYLFGLFQMAVVAVMIERAGPIESFGISARLVKGNWWRATTTMVVAFLIIFVLMVVAGIIVGIAAGISAGAAQAGVSSGGMLIGQQVLQGVLNLLVMAFYPSVFLAVYYDLKLRKEGGDLADRIGELSSPQ